jgi:Alanyl-tRNA synthetase
VGDIGKFLLVIPVLDTGIQIPASRAGMTPDLGVIIVENTNKINDLYLHRCIVESGSVRKGDTVTASINKKRRQDLRRNHSATHLLHFALRKS